MAEAGAAAQRLRRARVWGRDIEGSAPLKIAEHCQWPVAIVVVVGKRTCLLLIISSSFDILFFLFLFIIRDYSAGDLSCCVWKDTVNIIERVG